MVVNKELEYLKFKQCLYSQNVMKHSCLTTSMDAKLTEDGVMMQPTVHFV